MALLLAGCTSLVSANSPNSRSPTATFYEKGGSQTGVTLNDPGGALEALLEFGLASERFTSGLRAFALARFHPVTDDGDDYNDSFGAGFGAAVIGGTNVASWLDVHGGLGYVALGFTGPRALVGATLWPYQTGTGGGYAINVELDVYRGSRADAVREVAFNHVALTVGLELYLSSSGGVVYRRGSTR